jgi:hypothetical protein
MTESATIFNCEHDSGDRSGGNQASREELSAFRKWFQHFDADAWAKQFEQDVAAGRLDSLGNEALRNLKQDRCTDL